MRSNHEFLHFHPTQPDPRRSEVSSQSSYNQHQIEYLKNSLQTIQTSLQNRDQRDFLVNTGFSFEITDYFKFQNQKQLQKQETLFKDINQHSYIAWVILLYSILSSSMVPPWLMTIKADKLLRISWKCLLHLAMMTPMILYQHRTAPQKIKQQYRLAHILKLKHIKKVWLLALTASFWPTTILTSIEWTYISHCMVLGSLTNLYLSLERTWKGKSTKMEIFGSCAVFLGMLFVMYDSATVDVQAATGYEWKVFNYFYLTRKWWQRVLGDLAAILIGYCMSQFSKLTSDIKEYYPPYLLLWLNNLFTCIFMVFSAFFFNGATFDFNSQWGVFALFTDAHFTNFLYLSIVLTMGTFVSFVMVAKIFPDPAIPAIAMTLQPIFSTVLFHLAGVQTIPGPFGCFGYMIITPGMISILSGNCLQTRTKNKQKLDRASKAEKQIQMKPMITRPNDQQQKIDQFFDAKQY